MPLPGFGAHVRNRHHRRKLLSRSFRSEEEALFMSGVFSTTSRGLEEPGGAHRKLPLYAADKDLDRNNAGDCTKHRAATGALSPGLMVCIPDTTV